MYESNYDTPTIKSYKSLWAAVFNHAFLDALEKKKNNSNLITYFSLTNPDFIEVCNLNNICPKRAIKALDKAVKENLVRSFCASKIEPKKPSKPIKKVDRSKKKSFKEYWELAHASQRKK